MHFLLKIYLYHFITYQGIKKKNAKQRQKRFSLRSAEWGTRIIFNFIWKMHSIFGSWLLFITDDREICWWHDQKCWRQWLFLYLRIWVYHLYNTDILLSSHLETGFLITRSLSGTWCQAFIWSIIGWLPPYASFSKTTVADTAWIKLRGSQWFLSFFAHNLQRRLICHASTEKLYVRGRNPT